MGYKKDILPFFRMNSNSRKNEILADARMKSANADEIFGFASDEIKSTHPPSRRISSNEVGFHRRRRFHPPVRVDLVEKPTCFDLSVFLVEARGVEPLSKSKFMQISPGAAVRLRFPLRSAEQQALRVGSFMIHGRGKAWPPHVHHSVTP